MRPHGSPRGPRGRVDGAWYQDMVCNVYQDIVYTGGWLALTVRIGKASGMWEAPQVPNPTCEDK